MNIGKILESFKDGKTIRSIAKENRIKGNEVRKILNSNGYNIPYLNEKKPYSYWRKYEHCKEAAMKCRNRGEFYHKYSAAAKYSKKNGWIDDFDQFFSTEKLFYGYNDRIHLIYAYEVEKTHSVYVGRTTSIKRRDRDHRNTNDTLNRYCKANGIDIPQPKILEEKLNAAESQEREKYWVDWYHNNGWSIINVASTGKGSSSLGSTMRKWDYDACKKAASECDNKRDFREKYPTAARVSIQNKWLDDFFDFNLKKDNGYWDNIENVKKELIKYKNFRELRQNYPFVYVAICKNKWNDELKEFMKENRKQMSKKEELQKVEKKSKKDIFIEKARTVHQGENLDYSKVEYINNRTPVCIIDHDLDENGIEYGEFWQTPSNHLKGQKHPKKRNKRIQNSKKGDFKELIKKFDAVHQDENLDYSKSEYVNMHTPILVVDHTINENGNEYGEYYVIPSHHIKGGKSVRRRQCEMSDEFIKRSRKIHNGKYDYSKVEYEKYDKPVCIICPEHGEFWQTPSHHLNGCGCPKCNGGYKSNTSEFIEKAKLVHGDKYDYSETRYCGNKIPVKIICPEHGEFWQTPDKHLIGHGCQMCGSTISKAEVNICDIVKEIVGESNVIEQDRKVLNGRELDVYVPSKKVAFEYDGLIWHSEKFGKGRQYHISKTNECKEMGIRLIHIFEDEYLEHKDIVIKKIHHILGDDANLPIIGARKCEIKEITKNDAKPFLNEFHIQGFGSGTEYYGAFYNDRLLAVMVFLEERKREWNLTRFATDINCRIPGIASKLFKFFVKKHNDIISIKSFLDRRWNIEGNTLYEKLGFKLDGINEPDYYYVNGVKRYHKFNFRKQILHKKYGLPLSMTESEMTAKLGYYKIWNCGLAKYIWKPEK